MEGGAPAQNKVHFNTGMTDHTARAPGSDINIFWKLPVHSGPRCPPIASPQTCPTPLCLSELQRKGQRVL